ncbi:hypothetical protein ACIRNY_05060 [Capnocytophaga canimorsus]|uniref:Uncharacterized protein n=1 Tax=Capnocytophaga canimorsus (strain 5) TaxID=860228 RepID=F9YSS7_CAPCC|nr:hypothetical protein [Capnocytophaga canimorsus]AEK23922.1 Hypothetical protein Ccan_18060 [Capnocytophaga canimorsus Cc5]
MKNTLLITLLLLTFKLYAQIPNKSFFIIIDNKDGIQKTESRKIRANDKGTEFYTKKTTHYKQHQEIDLIYENGEISKICEYFYVNEPQNWQISFRFNNYFNGGIHNSCILMLPKERFKEIVKRKENYYIKNLEEIWKEMKGDAIWLFVTAYSYFDQKNYQQDGTYRDNVFMVFTSDLEKNYIPCYEVDVLISSIVEYCD